MASFQPNRPAPAAPTATFLRKERRLITPSLEVRMCINDCNMGFILLNLRQAHGLQPVGLVLYLFV